jgi:hypothetical protein
VENQLPLPVYIACALWRAECRSTAIAFEDRGLCVSYGNGFVDGSFVRLLFFVFFLL